MPCPPRWTSTSIAKRRPVFQQAWSYLRDNFFDPKFNGVDWNAVRTQYAPLIAGAATRDEMRRLLNLMVGELNASHSGVNGPPAGAPVTGKLGLRFDRATYEQSGRFKITDVIPLTPAAVAGISAGEYLLAVDGTPLGARVNLDQLLSHTINRRIELSVAADAAGANRAHGCRAAVESGDGKESRSIGNGWSSNRAYVAKASQGRLGYVHMFDMSEVALNQLFIDLDAENHAREGVVIDVRNNNGGFVNMYALDVFTRRNYLTMTPRGGVVGARTQPARTARARCADDPGDQSTFAVGRRGFYGRLSRAEVGQGRGRADRGLDRLHVEHAAARRQRRAAARHARG